MKGAVTDPSLESFHGPIQNRRALRLRMREQAERDFYYFNTQVLGWSEFYPPFHRQVCDWFAAYSSTRFRLTLLPRGFYKTTIGTEGQPLWRWLKDPDFRFLLGHQKRDTAEKALSTIKNHLTNNDKLKFIAPDRFYPDPERQSPRWLKDEIDIKRKYHRVPSAMATGLDASVTGLHFHWIIWDDSVTEDNIGTPEQLLKPRHRIQESVPLLVDRKMGRIDVIGTRWDVNDAYGWMLAHLSPESLISWVVACMDKDGHSLFPTRFTDEDLRQTAEEMGSFKFSALMMNNPLPDDVRLFDDKLVRFMEDFPTVPLLYFTAVDPNRNEGPEHDPGVVLTFGRDAEGNLYEAEITMRRFNVDDLVETVRDHVDRWHPEKVMIETTAGQTYLHQWLLKEQLERKAPYTIVPVSRGPNAGKQRILAIQPVVERGQLHLRKGDNPLLRELAVYRLGQRGNDHCLDALADVVRFGYDPRKMSNERKSPRGQFVLSRVLDRIRKDRESSVFGLQPHGKRW